MSDFIHISVDKTISQRAFFASGNLQQIKGSFLDIQFAHELQA